MKGPMSFLTLTAAVIYLMAPIAAQHATPLYHLVGVATLRIPTHAHFWDRLDFFVLLIQTIAGDVLAQILDKRVIIAIE